MPDIQDLTTASTSTPEQAVSNIQNATVFSLNPTNDKGFNDELAPRAEQALKPTDASPTTHDYMAQSTEHTALATPDIPHLNFIDETIKRVGDFVHGRPTLDQQISDLSNKKMGDPANFTDTDEGTLFRLNQERQTAQSYRKAQEALPPRDMFDFGTAGAEAVDHVADFLGGIGNGLAEAGTPEGHAISKMGFLGGGLALTYGFAHSAYKALAGSAYNDLSNQTNPDGSPSNIDETTKKHISMGVGIVGAAVQTVLPVAALEALPLSAAGVSGDATLSAAVSTIAKHAAVFGTTNAITEATRIVGEEIGRTYDGTQASYINGVVNAASHIEQNFPRLASAFGEGAAFGGAVGLGGVLLAGGRVGGGAEPASVPPEGPNPDVGPQAPSAPAAPKYLSDPELLQQRAEVLRKNIESVDTSNSNQVRLADEMKTELEHVQGQIDGAPKDHFYVKRLRDTQERLDSEPTSDPKIQQAVKVLQFKEAMNDVAATAKKTNMLGLAPGEFSDFMEKAFERTGVKKLYMSAQAARDFVLGQKPGASAESILAPNGVLEGQFNEPFEVDAHKVAEIAHEHPEIWDKVQLEPDGPTPVSGRKLLENVQTAAKERSDILQKLGLKFEEPAAPLETNVVKGGFGQKPAEPFDLAGHVRRADEILKALKGPTVMSANDLPSEEELRKKYNLPEGVHILYQGVRATNVDGKNGVSTWFTKSRETALNYANTEGPGGKIKVTTSSHMPEGVFSDEMGDPRTPDEHFTYTNHVGHGIADAPKILDTFSAKSTDNSKLQAELDQIKQKVQNHFKMNPPGKLLVGDWDELDLEDSQKAASAHVNRPTFTEDLEKALPKAEVQKFNVAFQNAGKATVDNIKQDAVEERMKVQDLQVGFAKDEREEQARALIASNPNYAVIEKVLGAAKEARKTKELSIYQIDPKSLTNEQIKKYADLPLIKERKVLKKGGSNIDDVAALLGVKDGDTLLAVLANTPTLEQHANAIAQGYAAADEQEARAGVDLNHSRIIQAINADEANAVAEMRYMLDHEWPALKTAIKRIALPPPNVQVWRDKATDLVAKTKVGSLNRKVYEVGERRSHRIAVKAILAGKPFEAYTALEARGINLAAAKEARLKIAQVDKVLDFVRKLNKKENKQLLKNAGPLINNAVQEILKVWNLRPENEQKIGPDNSDFNKWLVHEIKNGRGDFSIPSYLTDTRENVNDMTVEQLLVIGDRLRVLFQQAKMVGTQAAIDLAEEQDQARRSTEQLADHVIGLLEEHPGVDESRLPKVQEEEKKIVARVKTLVADTEAFIAPKQSIFLEADQGKTGGDIQQILNEQIEGAGKYYEKCGFTYEKKANKWLDASIKKINDLHGDIGSLERTLLKIPELKDNPFFNNGEMTKGDLLTVMANLGQKYTRQIMFKNNGGVSDETWRAIFDRELETKDVRHMQSIVDLYKDPVIRNKTIELQAKQGRSIEFIEGRPFVHKGLTYPGGYIRARYSRDYTKEDVKKSKKETSTKNATHFEKEDFKQYSSETTIQGYLTARVGSKDPISTSYIGLFDGLREIIHDHAYRLPLENFWNVMDSDGVIPALIKAVGKQKVDTIISINKEIAGRPSAKDTGYFTNPNRLTKSVLNKFGNRFAAMTLWGSASAFLKQAESLPEMFNALGPKSVFHFLHVNSLFLANIDKVHSWIQLAIRLDPNIAKYVDGVNEDAAGVIDKLVPRKGQKLERSLIGRSYEQAKNAGFLHIQSFDAYLKAAQAFTVVKHVTAGDHPNYPKEKFNAMSEQEQFEVIQSVIQQMSSLTQIQNRKELKAPIQKILALNWATFFWNYPRSILNNNIIDIRRTTWKLSEANAKLGQGGGGFGGGKGGNGSGGGGGGSGGDDGSPDLGGAAKAVGGAANIALSRMGWNMLGALLIYKIAGKSFKFIKDVHDWSNAKQWEQAGSDFLKDLMASNFEHFITGAPIANLMNYAIEHTYKYGTAEVRDPYTQGLSSIATCLPALKEVLGLSRNPNRMQIKACMEAESLVWRAFPVRGWLNSMDWLKKNAPSTSAGFHAQFTTAQVDSANKEMKAFVKDPGEAPKEFVAQVDSLQKQLVPSAIDIPAQTADSIKMAESGGKWNSPNGLYGFNSADWKSIMRQAPELGLTEKGRTAKDTSEQERAMEWSLRDHASRLNEKDIPVDEETLYATHVLGVSTYEKLFNAPGDAKVKAVLGDALKDHPELANLKTIGQVKRYLNNKADKGRAALAVTDKNLTSKTSNTED